jgi:hypothetical protein
MAGAPQFQLCMRRSMSRPIVVAELRLLHERKDRSHLYKDKAILLLLLSITMFLVRMRFSSVPKTWLARASAQ